MRRRGFFTAVGAAVAALQVTSSATVVSPDNCILCGFGERLASWGSLEHRGVMRCTDRCGCQARQINALLGTHTLWQQRTGIVLANGRKNK